MLGFPLSLPPLLLLPPQPYDYLAVLDFEAQCLEGERIKPQEIIEFPTVRDKDCLGQKAVCMREEGWTPASSSREGTHLCRSLTWKAVPP